MHRFGFARAGLAPCIPLILGGLLVLLAACSSFQIDEEDVFLPKPSITPATFDVEGVTLEEVFFPAAGDSVQLHGWYLTQPGARATVLFFGGQGFYLVQSRGYVEALMRLPVDVFMIDYRGYGRSGGQPSVEALKQDALAAYDYLVATLGVDPERVLLHGHSLGTFVALYAAQERAAAGVVLENPATSVEGWTESFAPWYLRLLISFEVDEDLKGESNVERVRGLQAPLLVFGGEEDAVTPPEMARSLYEVASSEKRLVVVEDGGHNGLYERPVYHEAYRPFIDRAVPAEPPG